MKKLRRKEKKDALLKAYKNEMIKIGLMDEEKKKPVKKEKVEKEA